MLATSNGGDKSSRNRNSLRLSGITVYAEEFSICGREMNCFFIRLSRDYFPCTQRFFGISVWGWYHYPRRALHAVETLDAQGAWRHIRRFYAVSEFAPCGQNIPSAGTHATPAPNRAHSGSHAQTGRVSDGGCYHYSRRALRGPEPLRAQRSEEHTLPSLHGPREHRREAESLRNGDAHRARLRSEAPRPRRVALLHCCFLRCTGKLRGSLSLRRRAERKIC